MDRQEMEATFRRAYAQQSQGVIVLGETGDVLYTNPKSQELLQIYYSIHHLFEIYQAVAPGDEWDRWAKLLNPPHQLVLATAFSALDIESRSLPWPEKHLVELMVQLRAADKDLDGGGVGDNGTTAKEFSFDQNGLPRTSAFRPSVAGRTGRLGILAEASAAFSSCSDYPDLLTAAGEYSLRLASGIGYSIYRLNQAGEEVVLAVDQVGRNNGPPQYPDRKFALADYSLLRQVIEEPTIIFGEGEKDVPGPPSWAGAADRLPILLLPLTCGVERFGAVVLAGRQGAFDEHTVLMLLTLINHVSSELERIRLAAEVHDGRRSTRRRGREQDA